MRGRKNGARISVSKSRQLVSTSEGILLRRRLKLDGSPEAVPFYPHEFIQRQSSMGIIDPSAMILEDIQVEQLDSLQRHRIRNAIKKYGGEQSLLPLADEELDGALGLCREVNGVKRPTITGLLMLGTEDLLRHHIPAYEVAFQVLQGTANRFLKPLRKLKFFSKQGLKKKRFRWDFSVFPFQILTGELFVKPLLMHPWFIMTAN